MLDSIDWYRIAEIILTGLSAIGTISATIVALWLAVRQDKVVLKASVYKAVMTGGPEPWPEFVAISITNRSKFSVQIDLIGWTLPKSPRGLSFMLEPNKLFSNGQLGAKVPFIIEPGGRSPLFTIPWKKFKKSIEYMMKMDKGGILHKEAAKRRIFFYVSTPRVDRSLTFKIDNDVMDCFIDKAQIKNI